MIKYCVHTDCEMITESGSCSMTACGNKNYNGWGCKTIVTNADKIRAMTDDQLAIFIESLVIFCLGDESLRNTERRLRWLKQETDR